MGLNALSTALGGVQGGGREGRGLLTGPTSLTATLARSPSALSGLSKSSCDHSRGFLLNLHTSRAASEIRVSDHLSTSFSVTQVLSVSHKSSLTHKPIWIGLVDWKYLLFLSGFCFTRLLACFQNSFCQDEISGEVILA